MALELWKQKLDELSGKVSSATDLVSQYKGASYEIPDMVKKRVGEIYNNDKDLIDMEGKAQEELNVTPYESAAKLQEGRYAGNPILAGQAAAQREASIERRLQNIRGIRKEREGTKADIINASTNAFNSKLAQIQGELEKVKTEYGMAESGYNREYKEGQDAEQNKISWYNAKKSGGADSEIKKIAGKYSYKVQKEDGEDWGFEFFDENDQPISVGKYFVVKNGGKADSSTVLGQMANLFKTSKNPDDQNIAREIMVGSKATDPDNLFKGISSKYPHLFSGL